jgi:hypothetical protein
VTAGERADAERSLREFIVDELLEEPFDGEDPLAEGAVDSLGIEQLIEYVYEVWELELSDEEIVEENFASIAALASLVDSKRHEIEPAAEARS